MGKLNSRSSNVLLKCVEFKACPLWEAIYILLRKKGITEVCLETGKVINVLLSVDSACSLTRFSNSVFFSSQNDARIYKMEEGNNISVFTGAVVEGSMDG